VRRDGSRVDVSLDSSPVALTKIAASGSRNPLIVSHEMIGRMLLRNLLDIDAAAALATSQPHDVVYQVDVPARRLTELRPA
jgi:broad specificity phosphatase PhoE